MTQSSPLDNLQGSANHDEAMAVLEEDNITYYEVPVEDATDKIFMAVALGSGTYKDLKVSFSGAGPVALILINDKDHNHMQFAINMEKLAAQLAERFLEEQDEG